MAINERREGEESTICVNMSSRDLARLREQMGSIEKSLQDLEGRQVALLKDISGLISGFDRLSVQFESMISARNEAVLGVGGLNEVQEKRLFEALTSDVITLGPDLPTREQIRTILEMMRQISDENDGYVPKEAIITRARDMKITTAKLEDILHRLTRAGALTEAKKGVYRLD
jgi:hypothetical protein